MLWISRIDCKFLYDLECAKWLSDTLQSLNGNLAERRQEDSYESWLRIETIETSKQLKWKAMHFVASGKLSNDTRATINGLPEGFLSLGMEPKKIDGVDWILIKPLRPIHRYVGSTDGVICKPFYYLGTRNFVSNNTQFLY